MKDCLNRDVRVGDVVSMPSYEYGTTLRVLRIDDNVIVFKRFLRGRKSVLFRFPKGPYWPRCDFRIVSR